MSADRRTACILALFYILSRVAWSLAGVSIEASQTPWLWQLLSPDVLRDDLWHGLLAQHSQPPLFNMLAAMAFKSGSPLTVFAIELRTAGLVIVVAIFLILRDLRVPRPIAAAATTLFFLNPTMVAIDRWVFYTVFEVALFAVAGLSLLVAGRYAVEGRRSLAPFVGFAAAVSGLIAIRPFYHPLFALVSAVIATASFTRPSLRVRRGAIALLWVPLAIGLVLIAKNMWLVGEPGTGSWAGLHASRVLHQVGNGDRIHALQRDGLMSPLAEMDAFLELSDYQKLRDVYAAEVPVPAFQHPSLTMPHKPGGYVNYNHVDFIGVSRVRRGDFIAYFSHYPLDYLKVLRYNLRDLGVPAASLTIAIDNPVLYPIVFWGRPGTGMKIWKTLVGSALLIVLFGGCARLFRAWRGDAAALKQAPAVCFVLISVMWVVTVGNSLEIGETYRHRAAIDPFLFTGTVWAICALFDLRDR